MRELPRASLCFRSIPNPRQSALRTHGEKPFDIRSSRDYCRSQLFPSRSPSVQCRVIACVTVRFQASFVPGIARGSSQRAMRVGRFFDETTPDFAVVAKHWRQRLEAT